MAPDQPNKPSPKPNSSPTKVNEPDPLRPPDEPVPKHPQKPEEYAKSGEERPETQGE